MRNDDQRTPRTLLATILMGGALSASGCASADGFSNEGDPGVRTTTQALTEDPFSDCLPDWRLVETAEFYDWCHIDKDNQIYGFSLEAYVVDRYHDDAGCFVDAYDKQMVEEKRCFWGTDEVECLMKFGLQRWEAEALSPGIDRNHCPSPLVSDLPAPVAEVGPGCEVPPVDRVDAGHPGISRKTCLQRGHCWDDNVPNQPDCYERAYTLDQATAAECNVSPEERYDAGWPGISRQTCLSLGGCWDASIPNNPDCYHRHEVSFPPVQKPEEPEEPSPADVCEGARSGCLASCTRYAPSSACQAPCQQAYDSCLAAQ